MTTEDNEDQIKEASELLGLDFAKLTASGRLRCELVAALRAVVDDALTKVTRGTATDLAKLVAATEQLAAFMKESPSGHQEDDDGGEDPYKNLEQIIAGWVEADKAEKAEKAAERAAQGLPAQPQDYESALSEISALRAEIEALKSGQLAALPAPALEQRGVIDPPTGDIVPRSEWQGVPPMQGPDDYRVRPKAVIDHEPAPPQNMPAPGLSFVPGIHGTPAKPGHVTEAQRQRVNADKSLEYRVMSQPVGRGGVQPSTGNESWRGHTRRFE